MGNVLSKFRPQKLPFDAGRENIYIIGADRSILQELSANLTSVIKKHRIELPLSTKKDHKKLLTIRTLMLKDQNKDIHYIPYTDDAAKILHICSEHKTVLCIIFIIDFSNQYIKNTRSYLNCIGLISNDPNIISHYCYFYIRNANTESDLMTYRQDIQEIAIHCAKWNLHKGIQASNIFTIQEYADLNIKMLIYSLFLDRILMPKSSLCCICLNLTRCKRCKCEQYYYCSRMCQKYHWSKNCEKLSKWMKGCYHNLMAPHRLKCTWKFQK